MAMDIVISVFTRNTCDADSLHVVVFIMSFDQKASQSSPGEFQKRAMKRFKQNYKNEDGHLMRN